MAVNMGGCKNVQRCRDGYFLEFHPYMFFDFLKCFSCNLFLLFFGGEKSVDGCVDGI